MSGYIGAKSAVALYDSYTKEQTDAITGSNRRIVTIIPPDNADIVLTPEQYTADILVIETGGRTVAGTIIVPNKTLGWEIISVSAYPETIKTAAGTGFDVLPGIPHILTCDGINVLPAVTRDRNVDVRQTVMTGPVDANGVADFLTAGTGLAADTTGYDSSPLKLTAGAGFDSFGSKIDYVTAVSVNHSFTGLTDSAVNYLYYDVTPATGAVTPGSTTLAPEYSLAKPSSPSTGQIWYPADHRSSAEYWDGAAWVPVLRVVVGQATTSGGSVVSVVSYAYQGRARAVQTGAGSTKNVLTHNLGYTSENVELANFGMVANTNFRDYVTGDRINAQSIVLASNDFSASFDTGNRLSFNISTASSFSFIAKAGSTAYNNDKDFTVINWDVVFRRAF